MSKEIPIIFSTDDNYIPYLDVAVSSLLANASKDYCYRIIVLNTGLSPESIAKVKQNACAGVTIDFVDISKQIEHIKTHLKDVYHFSVVTYYHRCGHASDLCSQYHLLNSSLALHYTSGDCVYSGAICPGRTDRNHHQQAAGQTFRD